MNDQASATAASDPLRSVSDEIREAAKKPSDNDPNKDQRTTQDVGAGIGHSVSRFAYTSSYMLSYGIVYMTVFVAKSIPQNNPIVEGFVDGGRAALDALNEARSVPVSDSVPS